MKDSVLSARLSTTGLGGNGASQERRAPFTVILAASKFVRVACVFLLFRITQQMPALACNALVLGISAFFFLVLQRPWSDSRVSITPKQWLRIFTQAVLHGASVCLWIVGLRLCGPVKSTLLFDFGDVIFMGISGTCLALEWRRPLKFQVAIVLAVSVLTLLWADRRDPSGPALGGAPVDDDTLDIGNEADGNGGGGRIAHRSTFESVGMSDTVGGALCLLLGGFLVMWRRMAARKLSVEIGGAKRLQAITVVIAALLSVPLAMLDNAAHKLLPDGHSVGLDNVLLTAVATTAGIVCDYYADSIASARMENPVYVRISLVASFGSALVLSWLGFEAAPTVGTATLIAFAGIFWALGSSSKGDRSSTGSGTLIGYAAGTGLPLYSFASSPDTTPMASFRAIMRTILESTDSRQIFIFLCINLCFMFVEFLYGMWTNSLGLISDAFHMLFDCTALAVGLYAAVVAKSKPTRAFSYGYGRMEVLSGFVNGVFLVLISFFVFSEAIDRIFDPPEMNTDRLLIVSVGGFCVNLVGIFAFSHAHSHGGGGGGGGGHGHSHGGDPHGHADGGECSGGHGHEDEHHHAHDAHAHGGGGECSGHGEGRNANIEGVFLHILADTLGSVGVIVSSLLIDFFGWKVADPICSIFIATLIFLSVIPLLRQSSAVLMLRTPSHMEKSLKDALYRVSCLEGVARVSRAHFWEHTGDMTVGLVHVTVHHGSPVSDHKVSSQIAQMFKERGITEITVQVDRDPVGAAAAQHEHGNLPTFAYPTLPSIHSAPAQSHPHAHHHQHQQQQAPQPLQSHQPPPPQQQQQQQHHGHSHAHGACHGHS